MTDKELIKSKEIKMFLRKLTLVVILVLCVNALSGCKAENEGGKIASKWHDVTNEICDVLNTIESEETAVAAIPSLEELAVEFTQAKNEFINYQKSHPGFEQKYSQESQRSMLAWGKALASFNTNQKLSKEVREEIMEILSL